MWNFSSNSLMNNLAKISEIPHRFCIEQAPTSDYQEFYQAIVCGSQLSESFFKIFLRNCGLLHLIVVSGSHLIFLGFFIDKVFRGKIQFHWKFLLLLTYALISAAQPPVIRALIGLCVHHINDTKRFFWTSQQQIWISMILSLGLFPEWITSVSFLLSSTAALALCLCSKLTGLKKHLSIYLLLLPVLLPLNPPHPLTALSNAFVAPLLGLVLFPLCALSFIFPIASLVDWLWFALNKFLSKFSEYLPPLSPISISKPTLWVYVMALNLFAIFFFTYRRRKNAVQS